MSLIEGVGDEVTIGVSIFILLCLVLLAWFSTHTRDIPFVSIIVVELSQRRNRNRNNGEQSSSGEEGATSQHEVNSSGENVSGGGTNGEEGIGSNNNAQTANDNEEGSEPSATSKSVVAGFSGKPCDVDNGENNKTATGAQTPGSISGEAEDTTVPEKAADSLENTAHVSAADVGTASSEFTRTESESVSSPVAEEGAAVSIPEYRPENQTSDEVRRRRVAYFEGQRDSKASEEGSDGRSCKGAESEQSSVGAQSQAGSDNGLPARTLSPTAGGVVSDQTTAATWPVPDSLGLQSGSSKTLAPSASTSTVVGTSPDQAVSGTTHTSVSESANDAALSPDGATPTPSRTEAEAPAGVDVPTSTGGLNVAGETTATVENATEGEQQIRVRLKYLNDTQRLVYAHPLETVGNFRRLHFSSELEDNKIVRFIFNGQDLRNDLSTLRAYNVSDNSVIHCLITQSRQQEQTAGPRQRGEEEDRQMGELMYPVFGLILGLVWYLRFSYKQYFNAMSTVSLAGVSFVYLLALFSSLRHRRQPHQHLD